MTPTWKCLLIGFGAALTMLQGCTGPVRKEAVPARFTTEAVLPGLPGVRYRPLHELQAVKREGIDSVRREQAYLASQGKSGPLPPAAFLALSGGGDNGAFGAGLLNGWTAAGNRPEFKLVTGISTGALIAPFAFLGPAYDPRLKSLFTDSAPADILEWRPILAALTNDALADNRPLWYQVEKEVDRDLLAAIAAEYEKGRLLFIATVDLDARQPVIWNMTRIAALGGPAALDLFRSIMIASAAIPGTFPPVMIDVEVRGRPYQEMHVDGGTMAQVFIYPTSLELAKEARALRLTERERTLYVIRNARIDPQWTQVERRAIDIAGRAISSLIHTQGVGDLYRIYLTAQRDGIDYHLAYIPADFDAPHPEDFDTEYMRALFQTGYDMAARGVPWRKTPPGL